MVEEGEDCRSFLHLAERGANSARRALVRDLCCASRAGEISRGYFLCDGRGSWLCACLR